MQNKNNTTFYRPRWWTYVLIYHHITLSNKNIRERLQGDADADVKRKNDVWRLQETTGWTIQVNGRACGGRTSLVCEHEAPVECARSSSRLPRPPVLAYSLRDRASSRDGRHGYHHQLTAAARGEHELPQRHK